MGRKDPEANREYMREYRKTRQKTFADLVEGAKECSTCGVEKPLEEFHRHPSGKLGRAECCKVCRQDKERFAKFGVTPERYDELCVNGCYVCEGTTGNSIKRLNIDHDHRCCPGPKSCGRCVRGVLCSPCNTLIGLAKDDPTRLRAAATYLEGFRGQ